MITARLQDLPRRDERPSSAETSVLLEQDLFGNTPIHWSCDQGKPECIQTLMEILPGMLDVVGSVQNVYGRTPKDVALLKKHDTCSLLMDM